MATIMQRVRRDVWNDESNATEIYLTRPLVGVCVQKQSILKHDSRKEQKRMCLKH